MRMKLLRSAALILGALASACASAQSTSHLLGRVQSAGKPVAANVTLYSAGPEKGSGELVLGSASTDQFGSFTISYARPATADAILYLIADGPRQSMRFASVVGPSSSAAYVTINEHTTVATAYAMAQFIVDAHIGGKSPGLQNAAGTLRNLVDPVSGEVGRVLATSPNGMDTSTMRAFNSLANMLAGCAKRHADCPALFDLARPPGGAAATDTLQAAVNIAHYPWHNAAELFLAAQIYTPYYPALLVAPRTWALAIKYVGNGHEFDGPGAMAFDENGNVWVTENYTFRKNHSVPACGSRIVSKLTATGNDAWGAPFQEKRAGVDGAGFGITLDPKGDIWIGNFGFFGSTCPDNLLPPANSVTKITADGTPLSPRTGFTQGCIHGPQGTVSDLQGSIWIANACGGGVTRYHNGNPDDAWIFDVQAGRLTSPDSCPAPSSAAPFGVAVEADGSAWITDNLNDSAFKLDANGALVKSVNGASSGIKRPLGIALDSLGNVWISNSRIIALEKGCVPDATGQSFGDLTPATGGSCVSELDPEGTPARTVPCEDAGMKIPWGIAVDGNDNLWVADFGARQVTQICGARPEHCPPGIQTGEPIAPAGYPSDALMRNTGVSIDQSGNVWLANNWLLDPVQTNPGGDGLVVFIGLAAPVKTPLIGPPRQP